MHPHHLFVVVLTHQLSLHHQRQRYTRSQFKRRFFGPRQSVFIRPSCSLSLTSPLCPQRFKPRKQLGGSTAGYGRWEGWRRGGGLQRYAAQRNDALQRGGTSRMSAYLRWGMVSPFRWVNARGAYTGGLVVAPLWVWCRRSGGLPYQQEVQ